MAGSAHSSSVLIIGGGLVAHAIAWRLARAGSEVTLLADGCAAASAASAGMLAPSFEAAHDRAAPNLKASLDDSLQQWDEFARGLEADSGMAIDYRRNGIVGLGETAAIGVRDPISVPAGVIASSAWLVPEEGQVDPRRALEALRRATAAQGVKTIVGHATRLREQSGRVIGVETDDGSSVRSDRVVLAAGMGSNRLLTDGPPLVPVRGRAFLVRCSQSPFVHVVRSGTVYFCPKADGTLYVGATEEGGDSFLSGLRLLVATVRRKAMP